MDIIVKSISTDKDGLVKILDYLESDKNHTTYQSKNIFGQERDAPRRELIFYAQSIETIMLAKPEKCISGYDVTIATADVKPSADHMEEMLELLADAYRR